MLSFEVDLPLTPEDFRAMGQKPPVKKPGSFKLSGFSRKYRRL